MSLMQLWRCLQGMKKKVRVRCHKPTFLPSNNLGFTSSNICCPGLLTIRTRISAAARRSFPSASPS
jgi:hypothetical protein